MRRLSHPTAGLGLVLLATLAVYAPSLGNDFTMDDRLVAVGVNAGGQPNPRIHELQPLPVYFSTPYWGDTNEQDALYRPLTVLSFALRHRLVGDTAWVAHLVNVLLHLAAVVLVSALLRRLAVSQAGALLGAALFGLHAVHSEAVVGVVGRAELLAFTLGAGALLLWDGGDETTGGRRLAAWAGAAVLLFGSFCSKESALAWVGFIAVYALARRWRRTGARIPWREVAAVALRVGAAAAVPLALFLLLRHRMLAAQGFTAIEVAHLVNPIFDSPAPVRLLTATTVLAYALILVALPFRLAADYSVAVFELVESPWQWRFVASAAVLAGLSLAALRLRWRHPLLFLAAAAFFSFSLLTSNLLFPIGTILGERLLYAPSLAVPLAGAWAWERTARRPAGRQALLLVAGLWIGASSLVVVQRNAVWRDDATLFLQEADNQPRSVRMQVNASTVHHERGELEAAANRLRRALELDPEHALAWNNLSAIRLEQGRLEEAKEAARRGLAARHLVEREDLFKLRCNLGLALVRRGRPREGAEELARCLHLQPAFLRPWRELVALEGQGVLQAGELEAIVARGEAATPGSPYWELYRGLLAHRRGAYGEAAERLAGAVALLPRHGPYPDTRAEAVLAFVDALVRLDRPEKALAHARDLAGDPFAPEVQRALARKVASALEGG